MGGQQAVVSRCLCLQLNERSQFRRTAKSRRLSLLVSPRSQSLVKDVPPRRFLTCASQRIGNQATNAGDKVVRCSTRVVHHSALLESGDRFRGRLERPSNSDHYPESLCMARRPSDAKPESPNHAKQLSYKFAMHRIEHAIQQRFFLEAVIISESIISDRLLSAARSTAATGVAKSSKHEGLSSLIRQAKNSGMPAGLAEAIDAWRQRRNQVAHAVAKSAPGEPTMSVSDFWALASETADEGRRLITAVKRWSESAKRGGTATAAFTFMLARRFEIAPEQTDRFLRAIGLKTVSQLRSLAKTVRTGERRKSNEKYYAALDRQLIPRIEFEVFFENFGSPEIVFGDRPRRPTALFKGARIVYFAVWDGDEDESLAVEVSVEASYFIPVRAHFDIENPEQNPEANVVEQLNECRNMFNISFRGFDYDDDEVLDHDWTASWNLPAAGSGKTAP